MQKDTTQSPTIVGIDEAGRGPLAGPVSAAACALECKVIKLRRGIWRIQKTKIIIGDSKMLTMRQREQAFAWLTANCAYGASMTSAVDIDTIGILAANERAMQESVTMLAKTKAPTYLLVDGKDAFWFDYPHTSIIGGDALEPCIAAASIIAKVTRDRWMHEAAKEFPQYGFDKHKGYASDEHFAALRKHGPCVLHRRTYLKKLLEREPNLLPLFV